MPGDAGTYIVAIMLRLLHAAGHCHDGIGVFRCELTARRRKPAWQDHRPALRAGRHVERSARLEVLAGEIDGMDFTEVGIHAGIWIGNHGVGLQDCQSLSTTWIHSLAIS